MPSPDHSFDPLALPSHLRATLQQLGYLAMTRIRAASLPLLLVDPELGAQNRTGSGKAVAFGLALVVNLNPSRFAVQALVLCPTREPSSRTSATR